ncbi:hypothetical protein VP1G_11317 [Cytospora mali]|uniref:Cyanovirin-N domain-containing protein n=1 Tax=Cytospora mali TaxID=578113 RepID=A0A194VC03_CYTMA|nr:hypothetical protein VP1G_11317 [Valsa mali var. pyri (nom. inval.)]
MSTKSMNPMLSLTSATALVVLKASLPTFSNAQSSTSVLQTEKYSDTISGYRDLSTCTENVLSTIVRAEYSGCQDSFSLTSYTCFCTDSSSYFSSVISKDVSASCNSLDVSVQASSALGVFDAYCALGVQAGLEFTQSHDLSIARRECYVRTNADIEWHPFIKHIKTLD